MPRAVLTGVRVLLDRDSVNNPFPDPVVLGSRTALQGLCGSRPSATSPYDVRHDNHDICFPPRYDAGWAPALRLSASSCISIMAHALATGGVVPCHLERGLTSGPDYLGVDMVCFGGGS